MDLSWLADFIALNESRSFSRAADRRHVTQPAFSRRIRALEDWAGAALFRRGPGVVTLTEPGRRFLPWAETLRRQVDEARADVRAGSQSVEAPLRIAATHSLSLTFAGWIESICERISLGPAELASESLTGCERLIVEGRTQFLLAHSHPKTGVRLDPAQFRSVSVGADALVPVAAPDLARAAGPDGRLAGLPFVTYSSESGLGRILERTLAADPETAILRPTFTSHHAGVLKSMVLSAQGVAWLPGSIIRGELDRGSLVSLQGGPRRAIALDIRLFRPEARLAAGAEAFWAAAVAEASAPSC